MADGTTGTAEGRLRPWLIASLGAHALVFAMLLIQMPGREIKEPLETAVPVEVITPDAPQLAQAPDPLPLPAPPAPEQTPPTPNPTPPPPEPPRNEPPRAQTCAGWRAGAGASSAWRERMAPNSAAKPSIRPAKRERSVLILL
jgi:type IV secretory pathway VirB10-like protein